MFRILVAEDDEATRLRLEHILYGAGYDPRLAADGAEAMELLDRKTVDRILFE